MDTLNKYMHRRMHQLIEELIPEGTKVVHDGMVLVLNDSFDSRRVNVDKYKNGTRLQSRIPYTKIRQWEKEFIPVDQVDSSTVISHLVGREEMNRIQSLGLSISL